MVLKLPRIRGAKYQAFFLTLRPSAQRSTPALSEPSRLRCFQMCARFVLSHYIDLGMLASQRTAIVPSAILFPLDTLARRPVGKKYGDVVMTTEDDIGEVPGCQVDLYTAGE